MGKGQSRKWRRKTIRICSRTFDLYFDPRRYGGEFTTSRNGGRGALIIGTNQKNLDEVLIVLLHEIIESILAIDGKRYVAPNQDLGRSIFTFNHDYLTEFLYKFLDALKSSKCFKFNDVEND